MKVIKKLVFIACSFLFIVNMGMSQVFAGRIIKGFDILTGIHQETGQLYSPDGYDMDGYKIKYIPKPRNTEWLFDDEDEDAIESYDPCFGVFNIHKAIYMLNGVFTLDGIYDWKNGYNRRGFNMSELHIITGTKYAPDGYDAQGFNRSGIHRETGTRLSPNGYDWKGWSSKSSTNAFTGLCVDAHNRGKHGFRLDRLEDFRVTIAQTL